MASLRKSILPKPCIIKHDKKPQNQNYLTAINDIIKLTDNKKVN